MHQSRICILVDLQEIPFCVQIFKFLISFIKNDLNSDELNLNLNCIFTCCFQINRNRIFPKMSVTTLLHSHDEILQIQSRLSYPIILEVEANLY